LLFGVVVLEEAVFVWIVLLLLEINCLSLLVAERETDSAAGPCEGDGELNEVRTFVGDRLTLDVVVLLLRAVFTAVANPREEEDEKGMLLADWRAFR
jgi:hypothetical protein